MSTVLGTPADAPQQRLSFASTLMRLALVGAAVTAVALFYGYLGGWFTPGELTPGRFVDGFEQVNGIHPGFRRNHAKGVGVSGYFDSNGMAVRLSKAQVFSAGRVPVLGRFSFSGGNPYVADRPDIVRGLGLQFTLPDGELWRTAMVNLPVFPVRTPEAFYEQILASKPDPATGKPDPARMKAFLEAHPEAVPALTIIKSQPFSSGFANSTFHGLNAFWFTNAAGASTPVRWVLVPEQPFALAGDSPANADKNYLFDDLIATLHRQPLRWHLRLIVGQPGDPTGDASLPWPAQREQLDAGILTLDRVESEETSPVRDINFDPLVLPAGITPSDDPVLSARSAIYSRSFTRRAGEAQSPSPITPAQVGKGEQR
jgi:catalase